MTSDWYCAGCGGLKRATGKPGEYVCRRCEPDPKEDADVPDRP